MFKGVGHRPRRPTVNTPLIQKHLQTTRHEITFSGKIVKILYKVKSIYRQKWK